ncbi:MAG: hypothetical protein LBH38_03625 [Holosporales bacterium]|nr:hypothetical protein [Holosporales bacterium]
MSKIKTFFSLFAILVSAEQLSAIQSDTVVDNYNQINQRFFSEDQALPSRSEGFEKTYSEQDIERSLFERIAAILSDYNYFKFHLFIDPTDKGIGHALERGHCMSFNMAMNMIHFGPEYAQKRIQTYLWSLGELITENNPCVIDPYRCFLFHPELAPLLIRDKKDGLNDIALMAEFSLFFLNKSTKVGKTKDGIGIETIPVPVLMKKENGLLFKEKPICYVLRYLKSKSLQQEEKDLSLRLATAFAVSGSTKLNDIFVNKTSFSKDSHLPKVTVNAYGDLSVFSFDPIPKEQELSFEDKEWVALETLLQKRMENETQIMDYFKENLSIIAGKKSIFYRLDGIQNFWNNTFHVWMDEQIMRTLFRLAFFGRDENILWDIQFLLGKKPELSAFLQNSDSQKLLAISVGCSCHDSLTTALTYVPNFVNPNAPCEIQCGEEHYIFPGSANYDTKEQIPSKIIKTTILGFSIMFSACYPEKVNEEICQLLLNIKKADYFTKQKDSISPFWMALLQTNNTALKEILTSPNASNYINQSCNLAKFPFAHLSRIKKQSLQEKMVFNQKEWFTPIEWLFALNPRPDEMIEPLLSFKQIRVGEYEKELIMSNLASLAFKRFAIEQGWIKQTPEALSQQLFGIPASGITSQQCISLIETWGDSLLYGASNMLKEPKESFDQQTFLTILRQLRYIIAKSQKDTQEILPFLRRIKTLIDCGVKQKKILEKDVALDYGILHKMSNKANTEQQ